MGKKLDEVTLEWVTAYSTVETGRDEVYAALNKIVKAIDVYEPV